MVDQLSPNVLIVGGDAKRLQWMTHHISSRWPDCIVASTPAIDADALARLSTQHNADILLLHIDFGVPATAIRTIETLQEVVRSRPETYIAVVARDGDEMAAVQAFKSGAKDYLPLSVITRDMLLNVIEPATERREALLRAAQAQSDAAIPIAPGIELPGYNIVKSIAASNFSTVYLARSERLRRNVVLKVINRGKSAREMQDAERFAREYEIISSISHDAIVRIHDFGALPAHLFLAIEYFPCGDLRDRLRNPLTVEESLYYLRAIAEALRVIHVFGIYHRDLKPGNVMLREDNSPVLIDFGLARRVEDDGSTTGIGKIMGSPYYISPEQAQARPVDGRTDLYSLGVIFHEMLTGRRPYLGRNAMIVVAQHVKSPLPTLPAELSGQQPILNKLMAKEPDDRYASADALLADLSESLSAVA